MDTLNKAFEERLDEILTYLDLLDGIETEAQKGPPRLRETGILISAKQQKILYSGVFVQLYNLVEATIDRCLDAVTDAAIKTGSWSPGDFTVELRREWVRVTARTHQSDMTHEKRLASALDLCEHLVGSLPVKGFKLEKGGGGNWNDTAIEKIAGRLGFKLKVSEEAYKDIKRPIQDDLGTLGLVVKLRNELAHGRISFAECGENRSTSELRELALRTAAYLRDVVVSFNLFIDGREYLVPEKRAVKVPA